MIKPYFNFHIEVKNLNSYRNFLKKRPKKAQQFKFTMIRDLDDFIRADEKQIQLKVLKALKIVKPVSKVDLGECEITDYDFWESKLLSALKAISHIKTFFAMGPKSGSEVNYFKYFPKLKNVSQTLNGYSSFNDYDTLYKAEEPPDTHYDLKSLKYCPKIHSLDFADFSGDENSPKVVFEPNRYLRSLESLVLRGGGNNEEQLEFSIDLCENLKSISLNFPYLWSWKSLPQILHLLSNLDSLQEIHLNPIINVDLDFLKAFKKITKKGVLQKVGFAFCYAGWFEIEKLLKALKTCKLTCFYLKVRIQEGLIKAISQFIKNMGHLESLELHIRNGNLFSEKNNFMELCKQIGKLQALRDLKLRFQAPGAASKDERISNFIPYLFDVFTKQVKIETLHLECHQLDPSEALQSLVLALGNSAQFLTHLKIDIGTLPCTKKTYRPILKLMQGLLNIQVLEIPCLAIGGWKSHFLDDITHAVHELEYLRVFTIGDVKDEAIPSDIYNAVEMISSKRGVRKFDCQLSDDIQESLRNEEDLQDLDLDRIFQKNPYLENFTLANNFSPFYFDIYRWRED